MSTPDAGILFIDAYDSFSENIITLLRTLLHVTVDVIKIDTDIRSHFECSIEKSFRRYDALVLGPGPGNPLNDDDIGLFRQVWKVATAHRIPVLGICLGFQSLCVSFGSNLSRLPIPCHGHARTILHKGQDIFRDADEIIATCYNSLGIPLPTSVDTPPISRPHSSNSDHSSRQQSSRSSYEFGHSDKCWLGSQDLQLLAWDDDGWVQAVRHAELPFWGVQFHPESCKSNVSCHELLKSWWSQVQKIPPKPRGFSRTLQHSQSLQLPAKANSCILSHLEAITLTMSKTGVLHTTQRLQLDRRQVAELCHRLSKHNRLSMLESSRKGRYSVYAMTDDQTWTLEYAGGECRLYLEELVMKQRLSLSHAMKLIEDFMSTHLLLEGPQGSPFWGGLIGYFSYEMGLDLLDITDPLEDPPQREVPDYSLMWVDRSIVVDKQEGCVYVQSLRKNDTDWVESTKLDLVQLTAATPPPAIHFDTTNTTSEPPSHDIYTAQIETCKQHLHAGNSYELCLTTSVPLNLLSTTPSFALHQHLLANNPSPYSAFLSHPSTTLLSSSPEQFLSWPRPTYTNRSVSLSMQPMKGTLAKYPGLTPTLASHLLRTPKEEAENLMIVDLIRHDLHRALGPESKVTVPALFDLVEAETVFQLISHISGTMPPPSQSTQNTSTELSLTHHKLNTLHYALSALRHTLPPGSMTGAPKRRSCEILRSVERRNRGVYAGVIGYLDVGGGGCFSVGIRCAFSPNKKNEDAGDDLNEKTRTWEVGAGGAVTVLSDTEAEWEEMRIKMESVLRGFKGG